MGSKSFILTSVKAGRTAMEETTSRNPVLFAAPLLVGLHNRGTNRPGRRHRADSGQGPVTQRRSKASDLGG